MSDNTTATPEPGDGDTVEPGPKRWPRWLPFAIAAAVAAVVIIVIVAASGNDDSTTDGTTTGSTAQSVPPSGSTAASDTSSGSVTASTVPSSTPASDTIGGGTTGSSAASSASTSPATSEQTPATSATTLAPGPALQVDLGPAVNFAVLGNTSVASAGSTTVTGQIGASNGEVTGFTAADNPEGMIIVDSQAAIQAQLGVDNTISKLDALDRSPLPNPVISDQTLVPGTYAASSLGVAGTVTLDAGGDPTAVFVFETSGSLTVSAASQIVLEGGAQACNVYWRVGSASLGSGSSFVGTLIADGTIGASSGSDVTGRLISSGGVVLLDSASVAVAACA